MFRRGIEILILSFNYFKFSIDVCLLIFKLSLLVLQPHQIMNEYFNTHSKHFVGSRDPFLFVFVLIWHFNSISFSQQHIEAAPTAVPVRFPSISPLSFIGSGLYLGIFVCIVIYDGPSPPRITGRKSSIFNIQFQLITLQEVAKKVFFLVADKSFGVGRQSLCHN